MLQIRPSYVKMFFLYSPVEIMTFSANVFILNSAVLHKYAQFWILINYNVYCTHILGLTTNIFNLIIVIKRFTKYYSYKQSGISRLSIVGEYASSRATVTYRCVQNKYKYEL